MKLGALLVRGVGWLVAYLAWGVRFVALVGGLKFHRFDVLALAPLYGALGALGAFVGSRRASIELRAALLRLVDLAQRVQRWGS